MDTKCTVFAPQESPDENANKRTQMTTNYQPNFSKTHFYSCFMKLWPLSTRYRKARVNLGSLLLRSYQQKFLQPCHGPDDRVILQPSPRTTSAFAIGSIHF